MRGVVTLAAAFVIPEDTPHREILLLIAFTVVAGTLFLQGLTLPWVARRLRVPAPDPGDDALARATLLQQASKAGLEVLERQELDDDRTGSVELIRQRIDAAQLRGLGAARHGQRARDAERAPTPGSGGDDRRRARPGAGDPERREGCASESSRDVLADARRRGVDARPARPATERRVRNEYTSRSRLGDVCDDLVAFPASRRPPSRSAPAASRRATGGWRLRQCLDCGNVGCCDSSPQQHATAHFRDSTHPVMQSAEPDEDWRWCFVHHLTG